MFGKTNWVLKGVQGAHAHAIFVLKESVILGRSASADIQILDQRVSRQHARILVTTDEVLVEDLDSHNGTFVHGHKVVRRALRTGDKLQIGVSVYVVDQLKGRVMTSAIFLNKLTTKDTMGATAVKRRMAKEILTSPTLDMPAQRPTQELAARVPEVPSEQKNERPSRPPHDEESTSESEPDYLRDQRARAVRLPTPMPGELEWSLHQEQPEPAPEPEPEPGPEPEPEPAPAPEARFDPPAPPIDAAIDEPPVDPMPRGMILETVPLDPRSQRAHTPIPESLQPVHAPDDAKPGDAEPDDAEPDADIGHEAALRTIDAVVRLLKLRAQESGGALLKIQDRENLRRLEGVLRQSRRSKDNRRRWTRLPCKLTASVGGDESDGAEARVTDIGAGGLRVSGNLAVEPGDIINIRVRLGEGRLARIAVFQTKVAWVNTAQNAFGALFDGPAHWEVAS